MRKHGAFTTTIVTTAIRYSKECPMTNKTQRNRRLNQEKPDDPKDKVKIRRAYILGGCLMFMWLSTHAILLYRRRSEHRALNAKLPPIPWEEFVDKYLLPNEVKTIIYQPQFEVGNVYLHSATEQLMKKALLDWIPLRRQVFARNLQMFDFLFSKALDGHQRMKKS
ncbi:hypothetical protein OSTOST_08228 [Ostertagia ostertagi]